MTAYAVEEQFRGILVRMLLGVVVIGIGIWNVCLPNAWHRVLGVIAIVVGLALCSVVWLL